jgi:hypothetical protein
MLAVTLAIALIATIWLGVYPRQLFELADLSAQTLGFGGVAATLR